MPFCSFLVSKRDNFVTLGCFLACRQCPADPHAAAFAGHVTRRSSMSCFPGRLGKLFIQRFPSKAPGRIHERRLQATRMGRSRVGSRRLLGGGVLPAAAPRGGRPGDGDGDGVGVCSQPSAQRAGRKRAAELAPALLTHRLVPESNHHLVFTEHLSWKAGNPPHVLLCPLAGVACQGIFLLALGFVSFPFSSPTS